jgi:hypothetical protein
MTSSCEYGGGDSQPHQPFDRYDGDDFTDDAFSDGYSDRAAITADEGDEQDDIPEDLTDPVEQIVDEPFTIVEIGSGGSPVLMDIDAPDVRRLFQEGGSYTAVDPLPWSLRTAAGAAERYIDGHANPDVQIETNFTQASIAPDTPLPEGLMPGIAHRVVIGNVLTHYRVEQRPEICEAIARTAAELLRRNGEVVVVGTLSPSVFPAARVTSLMESVGLEHVGSDDVSLHYPREFREDIPDDVYAERYRLRMQET